MESLGIVRKIDETGRIVLPKDFRRRLALEPNADGGALCGRGSDNHPQICRALHFLRLVRRHLRVRGQACLQGLLVKAQRGYPSAEQVKRSKNPLTAKPTDFSFYIIKNSHISNHRASCISSLWQKAFKSIDLIL